MHLIHVRTHNLSYFSPLFVCRNNLLLDIHFLHSLHLNLSFLKCNVSNFNDKKRDESILFNSFVYNSDLQFLSLQIGILSLLILLIAYAYIHLMQNI